MEKGFKEIEYSNEYFKKNIEHLLKENGLTKKEIESQLNIGDGSLTRYCKEGYKAPKPGINILFSLASGFGVTIDELINTDLSIKDNNIEVNTTERKDIIFYKKIIENTKNNSIDWKYWNRSNDDKFYEKLFTKSENDQFRSKYLEDEKVGNENNIIVASINYNISILIAKFYYGSADFECCYQTYLKTEAGEVISGGASFKDIILNKELDKELDEILDQVFKEGKEYIESGKDRFLRNDIFDKYINDYYKERAPW